MLDESTVRRLWLRLTEIYGHKWVSSYGADAGESAGQTWAMGLAGLTADQIRVGIRTAIASSEPWPPSLPEFRAMCLAVPPLAVVRAELAARNAVPSPFSRLVWSKLDTFRYRQAPADAADRLLREAYVQAREHVMTGGALPEEPVAEIDLAEEAARKPANPETARAALDAMSQILARSAAEPSTCT